MMECGCGGGIPRVVRGNDFTARVLVVRNVPSADSDGGKVTKQESIDLAKCNGIVARRITRLGRRTATGFAIDGSYVCVPFEEDVPCGSYGLEVAGRFANGQDWRFYLKPGEFVDIVEATSEGDAGGATSEDIYDFTAVIIGESLSAAQLAELQSAAENANAAAEEASKAAANATGAIAALGEAEAARANAEELRVDAESRRDTQEGRRASSETARMEAEAAREEAEAGRKDAEASRAEAEGKRAEAEEARTEAEAERKEAEEARAEAFAAAEKTRQETFNASEAERQEGYESSEKSRETAFGTSQKARQEAFDASEETRQETFEASEEARLSAFNASEETRQETFEASEKSRQAAFGTAEAERQETFEAAEAGRQSDYDTLKGKAETAIGEAENVDAELAGTALTVTDRKGRKRSVELVDYNERVTVTVRKTATTSGTDGTEAMTGVTAKVVVDEGKETLAVHEYTTDAEGKFSFTVPRGLLYEIFLPSVTGYRYVRTLRFTASLPGRDVEAVYEALPASPVAEDLLDTEVQWKDETAQKCVEGALGKNLTYRELINMPQGDFESMVAKMKTAKGDSDELLYQKVKCLDEFGLLENVTMVPSKCLHSWSSLESIAFPSVTSVGASAFSGCTSLESIAFPSVTSVGDSAFSGCTSLESIAFPSVTSVGASAFSGCTSLVSVSLPSCVTMSASDPYSSPFVKVYTLRRIDLRSMVEFPDRPLLWNTNLSTVILGATPPANTAGITSGCVVYVPDDAVETYEEATAWSAYTIKGWSELPEEEQAS